MSDEKSVEAPPTERPFCGVCSTELVQRDYGLTGKPVSICPACKQVFEELPSGEQAPRFSHP